MHYLIKKKNLIPNSRGRGCLSLQHDVFQVLLQDRVLHSMKHEADVLGVCGAREVGVDDFVTVGVQVHEHFQDEFSSCLGISLGSCLQERGDAKCYVIHICLSAQSACIQS